jgi:hypothetical protein
MKRQVWYHSYCLLVHWYCLGKSHALCACYTIYTIIPPRLFPIHSYMHFTLPVNFKALVKRGWELTSVESLHMQEFSQLSLLRSNENKSFVRVDENWPDVTARAAKTHNSHHKLNQLKVDESAWEQPRTQPGLKVGMRVDESWRENASEICISDQLSSSFDRGLKYVVR